MLAVVARAEETALFAEEGHEDDRALGMHFHTAERRGELDYRNRSAAVVVGAVIDLVLAGRAHPEMVVMGGDEDVCVFQHRVRAAQDSDDVAHLARRSVS